ncbi:unnamed protein product [Calypogeia fissa]
MPLKKSHVPRSKRFCINCADHLECDEADIIFYSVYDDAGGTAIGSHSRPKDGDQDIARFYVLLTNWYITRPLRNNS